MIHAATGTGCCTGLGTGGSSSDLGGGFHRFSWLRGIAGQSGVDDDLGPGCKLRSAVWENIADIFDNNIVNAPDHK